MKAETRFMRAVFGEDFQDADLHVEVDGVTLRDCIFSLLGGLESLHSRRPLFAGRIKRLVRMRFGFANGSTSNGGKTHREIGREFHLTGERVRQMEKSLLKMLRHPSRSGQLKPYIKTAERYAFLGLLL
jgi:DNA-directed RNA polymerase sigma subunit (sigma70/sigma32)